MNSGTPASMAPGPTSSDGISRATAAWMKRHSAELRNTGMYGAAGALPAAAAGATLAAGAWAVASTEATAAAGTR